MDEPDQMFGKAMSIRDDLMPSYFLLCTNMPMNEAEKIAHRLERGENPRDLKIELAQRMTALYWGEKEAEKAKEKFIEVFSEKKIPAGQQVALDAARLVAVERAVEEGGMNAQLFQRADLVVHQRDQRAHHHRDAAALALAHDGRHLVAQALAAAGGHQHQCIAAADHVLDDGRLFAAEGRVAEDFVQDGQRVGGQAHGARQAQNDDCRRSPRRAPAS